MGAQTIPRDTTVLHNHRAAPRTATYGSKAETMYSVIYTRCSSFEPKQPGSSLCRSSLRHVYGSTLRWSEKTRPGIYGYRLQVPAAVRSMRLPNKVKCRNTPERPSWYLSVGYKYNGIDPPVPAPARDCMSVSVTWLSCICIQVQMQWRGYLGCCMLQPVCPACFLATAVLRRWNFKFHEESITNVR